MGRVVEILTIIFGLTVCLIMAAVLLAILFWLFGGVGLRVLGIMCMLFAVLYIFVGSLVLLFQKKVGLEADANFLVVLEGVIFLVTLFGFGFVFWLAGHAHFAYKYHYFKSPLATRLFEQVLPERLNPCRNWVMPVEVSASESTYVLEDSMIELDDD